MQTITTSTIGGVCLANEGQNCVQQNCTRRPEEQSTRRNQNSYQKRLYDSNPDLMVGCAGSLHGLLGPNGQSGVPGGFGGGGGPGLGLGLGPGGGCVQNLYSFEAWFSGCHAQSAATSSALWAASQAKHGCPLPLVVLQNFSIASAHVLTLA